MTFSFGRAFCGLVGVGAFVTGCGVLPSDDEANRAGAERLGVTRSAVVGGSPSTAADDFIVYVTRHNPDPGKGLNCGGTLVAPNLILTAKHCVHEYAQESTSICDGSGEPQPGSTGGYITGAIPVGELAIYTGVDGRKRAVLPDPPGSTPIPSALGSRILDDKTPVLCSHDLAYLVLDRPITDKPIGKLRLGKRPVEGARITLAGWGRLEKGPPYNGNYSQVRIRRANIDIKRVGLPVAPENPEGNLGPRVFETGPGGCGGDSGSPGFDEATGGVQGVLVRAANLDAEHTISPCYPTTVSNVYMAVADFPALLREAFTAAGAEPWLEGRDAPGFLATGEACGSSLECTAGFCAGLTTSTTTGTCDVDCKSGLACPEGKVCGPNNGCVDPAPPPAPPAPAPPAAAPEEEPVRASGAGCAASPRGGAGPFETSNSLVIAAFLACSAVTLRLRKRLSSLPSRRRGT